jgi:hypothetical protein
MRFPPILAVSLCITSALGCAGVPRSTEHAYRQEGIPPAASGEVPASIVRIDGGAEYLADATISSSQVLSVRTVVRNRGTQLVTYDLARIVIAAADGAPLRLVGTAEEPSTPQPERPSPNRAESIPRTTGDDRVGSPTFGDHEEPAFARGTTGDDGGERRTSNCTRCTKDSMGGAGVEAERGLVTGLPAPEPDLFLLAGVAVAGRCAPAEARIVRAIAGLQAAIGERIWARR